MKSAFLIAYTFVRNISACMILPLEAVLEQNSCKLTSCKNVGVSAKSV